MHIGITRLAVLFVSTCFFVLTTGLLLAQERFPLAPADTSSPRATLSSFLENSQEGIRALVSGAPSSETLGHFRRADSSLDLSGYAESGLRSAATEAGLLLYEVLSRTPLPTLAVVPGKGLGNEDGPKVWVIPKTDIAIVRVEHGDRAGQYLFSSDTVRNVGSYYEQVRHLPVQGGYEQGSYEDYINLPNLRVPYLWARDLPDWAFVRIARNPLWKWAVVLAAGLVLTVFFVNVLGVVTRSSAAVSSRLGAAVLLVLSASAADLFVTGVVGLRFEARLILSTMIRVLAVLSGLAIFGIVLDYLTGRIAKAEVVRQNVGPQFVKLLGRVLVIIVVALASVEAAEFFGLNVTAVIAGLGVGGLAVALAARPTLENIIGGFILFADRPVRIGDFCQFGHHEGTIEEIGLRSTKVRRLDERLVTVPNATLSQFEIINFSRVRQRLYDGLLQLRYETTPDQLRYVLAGLRELLLAHPMVSDDRLHVRFVGFGAYSLDIQVFAYIRTQNWLVFKEIQEDINLRLMDLVEQSGTSFAFPSQTAYLARDNGVDVDKTRASEEEVARWRMEGTLPFPEHSDEARTRITDSLEYPPEGSVSRPKP